ncbi:MAG: M56 family metallopeptidase [Candidatus Aminicenantes bacterium]|nr:M56 family metallopeptidase [Candidatus Aminicenantes bacterium]
MGGFAAAGTLGLIAEYFLKTTAVLALALFASLASRRRPAAFRHFVLSLALIGLLFIPLLSLAPVGWRTSLLPARPAGPGTGTLIPTRPGLTEAQALDPDDQSLPLTMARLPELTFASTADGPAGAATYRLPAAGADPRGRERTLSPGTVDSLLAILWAAGLIVLFLRLAIGLAGAVKLTAQGTALGDPAWRLLLERFKALVSLRRNIRLRGHPEILVPMTWGFRKPVVLMPAGADAWTEEERSSALFHELSHIKRADFLVMLLVRTSLAAFWFNPLCWIVYRELRKEQEIACDELVLRAGIRPSTYAASLLAFRRSAGFRWNPSTALLGMLGRSPFHARLAAILKQKLTFKEVKMKTKIMLASAVVLAVALVGTARPAVGIEKNAARATVVESALPAPASFEVAPPSLAAQELQTEKAVTQEKEKEKAKAAEKAKKEKLVIGKKIVVTTKDGTKTPIVITITEGDEVKTLTLDKPLTITSSEGGQVIVLSSEGKDLKVLKGEPLSLVIEGGAIELLKEGKALKVGEGGAYRIVKEGGEEGGAKIVYYWTPKGEIVGGGQVVKVIKEGEAVEAAPEVFVKRIVVGEPVNEAKVVKDVEGVKVVVKKATEVEPEITWVAKEKGKEGDVWVTTKEFSKRPVEGAWAVGGGKAFAFSPAKDKEMLERVHALQEQVAAIKANKMDISALEESLKKLEAELAANAEKLGELHMTFENRPEGLTIAKKVGEDEAKGDVVVYEKVRGDKAEGATSLWFAKRDEAGAIAKVSVFTGDNSIQIVLVNKGTSAADFERAVVKLKKELPGGYKLVEQKLDAENGTMTFKISSPEGKKIDEQTIRKLVDSVKAEATAKK